MDRFTPSRLEWICLSALILLYFAFVTVPTAPLSLLVLPPLAGLVLLGLRNPAPRCSRRPRRDPCRPPAAFRSVRGAHLHPGDGDGGVRVGTRPGSPRPDRDRTVSGDHAARILAAGVVAVACAFSHRAARLPVGGRRWRLSHQARHVRPATRRGLAFIASGAVPLLALCGAPPDPMLLIYSVFVGAWVLRGRVSISPPGRFPVGRLAGPVWLRYFVLMVLVGFPHRDLGLGRQLPRPRRAAGAAAPATVLRSTAQPGDLRRLGGRVDRPDAPLAVLADAKCSSSRGCTGYSSSSRGRSS